LEALPNVTFYFNHKLTGADFNTKRAWFERQVDDQGNKILDRRPPEIEVSFDFLIGADGAHSSTRYHLMKFAPVDYQQAYIDTLWCEFHIEPDRGAFAISPNHLHIWPGADHMFIAIPSVDRTFTCTLFAPRATFNHLYANPGEIPHFFQRHFPGISPERIAPNDLITQFTSNPHLPLISIKCTPYHYTSTVVVLGDAAHAMVPFYGQGMNAGLEDVRVLFEFLDTYGVYPQDRQTVGQRDERRMKALEAYTRFRAPDAAAINDLALENYVEMRSKVVSPAYLARKAVEEAVSRYIPISGWTTQYTRVSFENQRYSHVVRAVQRQAHILFGVTVVVAVFVFLVFVALWYRFFGHSSRSEDSWDI
jgi:kynurenine 3-monooxygenase